MCTSSFTTFQVRQKNVPIVGFEPGKLEGGGVWGGVIVVAMSDGVRNGKVPSCKQTVFSFTFSYSLVIDTSQPLCLFLSVFVLQKINLQKARIGVFIGCWPIPSSINERVFFLSLH